MFFYICTTIKTGKIFQKLVCKTKEEVTMKLRVIRDKKDHNKIYVHLDVDLDLVTKAYRDKVWKDSEGYGDGDSDKDCDEAPTFITHILQVKGIENINFEPFCVNIIKGEVFSWKKLLPAIITNLELDFNDGDPAEYSGAYTGANTFVTWILSMFNALRSIPQKIVLKPAPEEVRTNRKVLKKK